MPTRKGQPGHRAELLQSIALVRSQPAAAELDHERHLRQLVLAHMDLVLAEGGAQRPEGTRIGEARPHRELHVLAAALELPGPEQSPEAAERQAALPPLGHALAAVELREDLVLAAVPLAPANHREDANDYLPCHPGGRFSANAVAPSRESSDTNTGPEISSLSCQASGSSTDCACDTIRFEAASASGALAATVSASDMASSSTVPGSTARFTSPSS